MTISTTVPESTLSIVSAFYETRRGEIHDSVAVLERTPIGSIIRAHRIGAGIEEETIREFQERFPTAICECKI